MNLWVFIRILFFFFKQKTAYEMRISDWSSDVCSSDLRVLADGERIGGRGWTLAAVATPGHTSNHLCFALLEEKALFTGDHVMGWSTSIVYPPDGDIAAYMASMQRLPDRTEIGRAHV